MIFKKLRFARGLYSQFPRYRKIFYVFFKFGFGDVLKKMRLQTFLAIAENTLPISVDYSKSPPERFRMALEELGPTFVKFGQVLSTRRDLIDETWVAELSKLQDQVAPFPGKQAIAIVEKELRNPVTSIFKEFDETPLASASMAQVHRAVLPSGEKVAVKVQRPDISDIIEIDLAILLDAAVFLEGRVDNIAALDPVGIIKEFSKIIATEQDFTNEARNMERFARQFEGDATVRIPAVHRSLSTDRVLVMEFVPGHRIDDLDYLKAHDISAEKLSRSLSEFIFKQIFHNGFFHADPHPGNMGILPDGQPVLYDYGMMGTVSPRLREDIANLVVGLAEKDHRMVTRSILGMSHQGSVTRGRELENDMEIFATQYLDRPLKELKLAFVFNRILEVLMRHHLRMKPEFYLGIKALSQVEAFGAMLDPDLHFVDLGEPFASEVLGKKWDFGTILRNSYFACAESVGIFRDFPSDVRDLYEKIKSGRFGIPIEHRIDPEGFEPLRQTLNHVANRLTHSIVMAAVFMGSCSLVAANVPPLWHGLSVLGIAGLSISCLIGLRLWSSMRKGNG